MRTVKSSRQWSFNKGATAINEWDTSRLDRHWLYKVSNARSRLIDSVAAQHVTPNRVVTATYPLVDSLESAEELLELYGRAVVRDVNYSNAKTHNKYRGELPGSSKGEFVSWFLREPYVRGHLHVNHEYDVWPQDDYMQSPNEWRRASTGERWGNPPVAVSRGDILTPRDGAAYVFRDDASEQYLGVDALLTTFGVSRNPSLEKWLIGDKPDHFFGLSDLQSIRGQLIKAVGDMVKSLKWHHMRLRPEELAAHYETQRVGIDVGLDRTFDLVIGNSRTITAIGKNNGTALLSQVYPNGCPLDPSYPSMHSMLAWANHAITCIYWNQDAGLLTGDSVQDESEKLTDNIGLWRLDAGVNYRSDHYLCADIGTEIAERLVEQRVQRFGADMEFSYRRFDGSTMTFKN